MSQPNSRKPRKENRNDNRTKDGNIHKGYKMGTILGICGNGKGQKKSMDFNAETFLPLLDFHNLSIPLRVSAILATSTKLSETLKLTRDDTFKLNSTRSGRKNLRVFPYLPRKSPSRASRRSLLPVSGRLADETPSGVGCLLGLSECQERAEEENRKC